MNLSIVAPLALAALAALLLPLVIHLRRRPQTERVDFAALRWLQARLRPRRQLRLSERRLLIVRLLLITLLVVWLAAPQLHGGAAVENWLVVTPNVSADFRVSDQEQDQKSPRAAQTHQQPQQEQQRWLAPGFPALTEPRPPARQPIASLLRELDAELPAGSRLTVVLPARSTGFDGERLRLSRTVRWLVEPGEEQEPISQKAQKEAQPGRTKEAPEVDAPAIRAAADRMAATRYLSAAVRAWNTPLRDGARATEPVALDLSDSTDANADKTRRLIWLHPGPLPDNVLEWVRSGGVVLVEARTALDGVGDRGGLDRVDLDRVGPDLVRTLHRAESSGARSTLQAQSASAESSGPSSTLRVQSEQRSDKVRTHAERCARCGPQARRLGSGRVLQLAGEFTPAFMPELLDPDFPTQLSGWFERPQSAPSLAPTLAQAPLTELPAWPQQARSMQPWLMWILLAIFGLERWLASAPRRQADP